MLAVCVLAVYALEGTCTYMCSCSCVYKLYMHVANHINKHVHVCRKPLLTSDFLHMPMCTHAINEHAESVQLHVYTCLLCACLLSLRLKVHVHACAAVNHINMHVHVYIRRRYICNGVTKQHPKGIDVYHKK